MIFFSLKLKENSDRQENFMISGETWQAYESLLASLGDRSNYPLADVFKQSFSSAE